MNIWSMASVIYITLALITFIPTFLAIIQKIKLHPGGASFDQCSHFSNESKEKLVNHYSRIKGTLTFWKNQAEKYKQFHFYCLGWTIPSATLVPIITQAVDGSFSSKLFLTIVSTHTAILLGFYKGFKVENNIKSFRHGESEFYDLYRRLLDRPITFGNTEEEQLDRYFSEVQIIRKYVRNAETDNFPSLEESRINFEGKTTDKQKNTGERKTTNIR